MQVSQRSITIIHASHAFEVTCALVYQDTFGFPWLIIENLENSTLVPVCHGMLKLSLTSLL